MPNLNQRLKDAQDARDRYKQELEDHRAAQGWIDPEYAATIRLLNHLATGNIRRGNEANVTSHPQSRPPAHDEWAYDQLRKQRTHQREQSAQLRAKVRARYNNGHPEEAPDTATIRDKPVRWTRTRPADGRNLLYKPNAAVQ